MLSNKSAWATWTTAALLLSQPVWAASGGQNMLLVVNPNDEQSLRIVNEYVRLRAIPTSNIVYLAPNAGDINTKTGTANLDVKAGNKTTGWETNFINNYMAPIYNAIQARALAGQVDYISTIGLPTGFTASFYDTPFDATTASSTNKMSLESGLTQMDVIMRGEKWTIGPNAGQPIGVLAASTRQGGNGNVLFDDRALTQKAGSITLNSNTAIRHTTAKNAVVTSINYNVATGDYFEQPVSYTPYMAGRLAYTGFNGNTVNEVIRSLRNAAAADGVKPTGTVYFCDSNNDRSRALEWPATVGDLAARGISSDVNPPSGRNPDGTFVKPGEVTVVPINKPDVLGAATGSGVLWNQPNDSTWLPSGSTYMGGSFADNMTSYGTAFADQTQSKATRFIAAGAAGTSGTVAEPFAIQAKFTNSSFFTFMADGSTHGESYSKSVILQEQVNYIGDMLAKPFADIPAVGLSSAPANGATVSGTVNVSANATLPANKKLATAVAKVQLWVDGKLHATTNGSTGNFALDTSTLADGHHELRVVAINNAAAQSEGFVLRDIVVNNKGRSVAAGGDLTLQAKQTVNVPVSFSAGTGGTITRIELRQLGRVIASGNGTPSSLTLDATKLSYGDNPVVPVAVFSDGTEVAGAAFTATRQPHILAGKTPASTANRIAGMKAEYWENQGSNNTGLLTFNGAPIAVTQHTAFRITGPDAGVGGRLSNAEQMPVTATQLQKLSARFTAMFTLDGSTAGEYQFFPGVMNDCYRIFIDGEKLWDVNGSFQDSVRFADSTFLGVGEHTLVLEAGHDYNTTLNKRNIFNIELQYKGPDGWTRTLGDTDFYATPLGGIVLYTAVPEPASLALLGLTLTVFTQRRRSGAANRQGSI